MASTGFRSPSNNRSDELSGAGSEKYDPNFKPLSPAELASLDQIEAGLSDPTPTPISADTGGMQSQAQDPERPKVNLVKAPKPQAPEQFHPGMRSSDDVNSLTGNGPARPMNPAAAQAQDPNRPKVSLIKQPKPPEPFKAGMRSTEDVNKLTGNGPVGPKVNLTKTPSTQQANAPKVNLQKSPNVAKPTSPISSPGLGGGGRKNVLAALKKRKNQVYMLVAVILAVFSIIGFLLAIPFKLVHIVTTIFGHGSKNNNHTTQRATDRFIERLFLNANSADGGTRSRTGRPLKDFLTNHRISKLDKLMDERGIVRNYDAQGRLTSLEHNGETIKNFKDASLWQRSRVGSITRDVLDVKGIIRRIYYNRAMRVKFRVSFKFWAIDKGKSLKAQLADKVLNGDKSRLAKPGSSPSEPDKAKDPKAWNEWKAAQDAAAQTAQNNRLGSASEAVIAEANAFNANFDKKAARKAAVAKFRETAAGKAWSWTGYATIFCMIREIIDNQVLKDHYIARAENIIRAGSMLVTQLNEMQEGHVPDLGKFDEMMGRFDGTACSTDQGANCVDSKSFDQSAAWQRITGGTVQPDASKPNSYTPDLNPAANPNNAVMNGFEQTIQGVLNIPGEAAVCSVLNSWVGWVIGAVEVGVAIWVGESSTIASIAVSTALISFATEYILPIFLDAGAELAVTGTENAVDTISQSAAGISLSELENGRSMGDRQGTDAEAAKVSAAADAEQNQIASSKGWFFRDFSIYQSTSITSKIVEKMPSTPSGAVAAMVTGFPKLTMFSDIPTTAKNLLAFITHSGKAHAAASELDPYGFQAQVTSDSEIDNSDPQLYEDLLYQPILKTDGSHFTKSDGSDLRRIDMLGDPNKYTPDLNAENGNDPNSNDLLHCFVNKMRDPNQETTIVGVSPSFICRSLGIMTKVAPDAANPKSTTDPSTLASQADNPGANEITGNLYCTINNVCGLPFMHTFAKPCPTDIVPDQALHPCGTYDVSEFDIYRLYLKYVMIARGLVGLTDTVDPFDATTVGI
jgi:hypothetical protein